MEIKNIENTNTISVKVPIDEKLKPEDIDSAIKDLTLHGFKVVKEGGYLKISESGATPEGGFFGGLGIRGLVNYFLLKDIINLEAISGRLGVRIVSDPKELALYQKSRSETPIIIIIPDTPLNERTPKEVEEISRQILKNSDERLTLGLEFPSDHGFEDLINNPAQNLTSSPFIALFSEEILGKTFKGLVEAFNRLRSEYGDRVRIKPIGGTQEERRRFAWQAIMDSMADAYLMTEGITPERHPNLDYEYSKKVLSNILDLLKTGDNKVIWVGILNATDLLYTEGDLINDKNTVLFLTPETLKLIIQKEYIELQESLHGTMRD